MGPLLTILPCILLAAWNAIYIKMTAEGGSELEHPSGNEAIVAHVAAHAPQFRGGGDSMTGRGIACAASVRLSWRGAYAGRG
jgi:hypothetical protein